MTLKIPVKLPGASLPSTIVYFTVDDLEIITRNACTQEDAEFWLKQLFYAKSLAIFMSNVLKMDGYVQSLEDEGDEDVL